MPPQNKKPTADSTVFRAAAVEKLHQALLNVFRKHIREVRLDPVIDQVGFPLGAWKRARVDRVEFELLQLDEFAERPRTGGIVHVARLAGLETVWVSWYERWRVKVGGFIPDGMSLAFWVGEESAAKELMFRAEWDHTDSVTPTGAAQPHWNIDHPVGARVVIAEREVGDDVSAALTSLAAEPVLESEKYVQDGLVELSLGSATPPVGGVGLGSGFPRRVIVSRYHLGMAGSWTSSGRKGWQLPLVAEAERLPDWLELCLGYVASEIGRYGVQNS